LRARITARDRLLRSEQVVPEVSRLREIKITHAEPSHVLDHTFEHVFPAKRCSVASGVLPGFAELNIRPKAIEEIVPIYIGR
jgi:hypothetical protein